MASKPQRGHAHGRQSPRHHHHQHGHHAHDHNSMSFTERNRAHWDQFASTYTEQQWQKDFVNKVTEFILSKVDWLGVDFLDPASQFEKTDGTSKQVRFLDYACGPGTVTNALAGRASEYVGIDLSENMVKAYNTRFSSNAESEGMNAHAVVGNLLDGDGKDESLSDPKFFNFDLAAVGLGFHHFENVQEATQRLVERLKPGGVFMIIDFAPHSPEVPADDPSDDSSQQMRRAMHTVAHHGFTEGLVKDVFKEAGLVDVGIVHMDGELLMRGVDRRKAFMAKGRKP